MRKWRKAQIYRLLALCAKKPLRLELIRIGKYALIVPQQRRRHADDCTRRDLPVPVLDHSIGRDPGKVRRYPRIRKAETFLDDCCEVRQALESWQTELGAMDGWAGLEFFAKFVEHGRVGAEVVAYYAKDRGGWRGASANETFELAAEGSFSSTGWGKGVACQELVEHDSVFVHFGLRDLFLGRDSNFKSLDLTEQVL